MGLRPRQTEALDSIKKNYLQGNHRQVVSACTGFGKSVVLSHIPDTMAGTLDGQTLVIVHRDELIDQNIDKLRKYNPNAKVSKEKAESFADVDAEILVASVQTLGRKDTKRTDRFNWDNITKVITDECQHATSQAYINIYEKADVLRKDTHKLHVGFSATPNRSDGNTLAKIYDKIVFDYPLRQAITEGWLVDVKGIRIETEQSLDNVSIKNGDFDQTELSDAIDNPWRNQIVVKGWLEHGQNRQTIGFTASIKHAVNLQNMFQENGVNAVAIWGADPERKEKLERFRKGEITVLLCCALLIEGFDMWQVACVMHVAPTQSVVAYVQKTGRGTRLEEGCGNLLHLVEDCSMTAHKVKKDCIILDFCDLSKRHSLTTLPTLFGLPPQLNLKGRSATWAANELEKAQVLFTHVDFSTLKDINKIKLFVQETDLFSIKSLPEVENNSNFVWHRAIGGGYILMLPEKDSIKIEENLLTKWEIKGKIKNKTYRGERDTIAEAFAAGDKLITETSPEVLKLVDREAAWRKGPPSTGQMEELARLFKNKPLPNNLTKGTASDLIGATKAAKPERFVPKWVKYRKKKDK
jgi:superfamily II DNA or RNA helicase